MIDNIVKMITEEAWRRDRENAFATLFEILGEINSKAVNIILDDRLQERREEIDRSNDYIDFKGG